MAVKRTKEDIAFRKELLESRGEVCQRCAASKINGRCKQIHVAHIFSRGHQAIRHDPRNVVLLCASCHWATGKDPVGFTYWLQDNKLMSKSLYKKLKGLIDG